MLVDRARRAHRGRAVARPPRDRDVERAHRGALLINCMLAGSGGSLRLVGRAARSGGSGRGGGGGRGRAAGSCTREAAARDAARRGRARAAGLCRCTTLATGLVHPTAMSFGPDRRLYVSEDVGEIVSVVGWNAGGRVASPPASIVPLGLLWRGGKLYVSESGRVRARARRCRRTIVSRAAVQGRHQQDCDRRRPATGGCTSAPGRPATRAASATGAARRSSRSAPTAATSASSRSGFAIPMGSCSHGRTLYATVNGKDKLGDGEPAEMVVRVRPARDYRLAATAGRATRSGGSSAAVGRHAARRVPRAALLGGRDRVMARRSLRRGMGRVPRTKARPRRRAHPARARDDVRHGLRPPAGARRRAPAATCWSPTGAVA